MQPHLTDSFNLNLWFNVCNNFNVTPSPFVAEVSPSAGVHLASSSAHPNPLLKYNRRGKMNGCSIKRAQPGQCRSCHGIKLTSSDYWMQASPYHAIIYIRLQTLHFKPMKKRVINISRYSLNRGLDV